MLSEPPSTAKPVPNRGDNGQWSPKEDGRVDRSHDPEVDAGAHEPLIWATASQQERQEPEVKEIGHDEAATNPEHESQRRWYPPASEALTPGAHKADGEKPKEKLNDRKANHIAKPIE